MRLPVAADHNAWPWSAVARVRAGCRDDCWELKERADNGTGHQQPDPAKFPDGIKNVTDYVHSLGLKFGLYTAQAHSTCGQKAGSCGFENIDAAAYAAWGVDYL